MRSNPPPAVTWGGCHVPSKTPADARSRGGGWRLCRRQEGRAAVSGTGTGGRGTAGERAGRTSRHLGGPSAGHYGPPGPGRARRDTVDARSAEPARGLARAGRADRRRIRHRQGQAARQLGAEQPTDLDPGYQGRLKEHRMSKPFKGTINVDIRDSAPDWEPFEPPKAPEGAPNVVYIVLDDVGFSAMSAYGGPIETPNIDRIANDGVRYTQWHTTALCSPTRSCLLTRRNHTRNSLDCITEAGIGLPKASGTIPPENGMLPEIL